MTDFSKLLLPSHRQTIRSWLSSAPDLLVRLEFPHSGGAGVWYLVRSFEALLECLSSRIELWIEVIVFKNGLPVRGIMNEDLVRRARVTVPYERSSWLIVDSSVSFPSSADVLELGDGRAELGRTARALYGQEAAFGLDTLANESVCPEWAIERRDLLYLGALRYRSFSCEPVECLVKTIESEGTSAQAWKFENFRKKLGSSTWLELVDFEDWELLSLWLGERGELTLGLGPGHGRLRQEKLFFVSSVLQVAQILSEVEASFTATIFRETPFDRVMRADGMVSNFSRLSEFEGKSNLVVVKRDEEASRWRVIGSCRHEGELGALHELGAVSDLYLGQDTAGIFRTDLVASRVGQPELVIWRFFANDRP